VLAFRLARLQAGGQEVMRSLVGGPVRAVQKPEPGQVTGTQPGFLQQFQPGQVLGAARLPGREPALRERPGAPPDRVPEFLDEMETVVLGRDDEREVAFSTNA